MHMPHTCLPRAHLGPTRLLVPLCECNSSSLRAQTHTAPTPPSVSRAGLEAHSRPRPSQAPRAGPSRLPLGALCVGGLTCLGERAGLSILKTSLGPSTEKQGRSAGGVKDGEAGRLGLQAGMESLGKPSRWQGTRPTPGDGYSGPSTLGRGVCLGGGAVKRHTSLHCHLQTHTARTSRTRPQDSHPPPQVTSLGHPLGHHALPAAVQGPLAQPHVASCSEGCTGSAGQGWWGLPRVKKGWQPTQTATLSSQ